MKNDGFIRLLDFTPASIQEALKGKYGRIWTKDYRLTILKSHAFFVSDIRDEDFKIKVTLPVHAPFYMLIMSANGVRTVLVEKDIEITLSAGEQAQAQFTLKM